MTHSVGSVYWEWYRATIWHMVGGEREFTVDWIIKYAVPLSCFTRSDDFMLLVILLLFVLFTHRVFTLHTILLLVLNNWINCIELFDASEQILLKSAQIIWNMSSLDGCIVLDYCSPSRVFFIYIFFFFVFEAIKLILINFSRNFNWNMVHSEMKMGRMDSYSTIESFENATNNESMLCSRIWLDIQYEPDKKKFYPSRPSTIVIFQSL